MTGDPQINPLNALEQIIRRCGKSTDWIRIEPLNQKIIEDLKNLTLLQVSESNNKTQTPETGHPDKNQGQSRRQQPKISSEPPPVKEENRNTPAKPDMDLDPMAAQNLDSLHLRLRNCEQCKLSQTRSTVVFGQGNQKADLVFIGEAPGEEEDRSGIAFVGRAGKLLTQWIHSIGLNREAVYICNIIKCRPPGNRNPNEGEISACSPFLYKQLDMLQPKLIVTMGNVATKTLIPGAMGIMRMRGKLINFKGTPLLPTFHPSFLLRNRSALIDVWNDMRQIRQILHQGILNSPSETHPQADSSL
jgi:uracil-DNA glycosylase